MRYMWDIACQVPLSVESFKQEYWSRLPFPSPGDLPNPGIEPGSPALQADSLRSEPPGKPQGQNPQVKPELAYAISESRLLVVSISVFQRRLSTKELMLLNCGAGEDS